MSSTAQSKLKEGSTSSSKSLKEITADLRGLGITISDDPSLSEILSISQELGRISEAVKVTSARLKGLTEGK